MKPEELLYAETHEWIAVEETGGEKTATLGLSAFAVELLTDLVYIELPTVGQLVEARQPFCVVESVKAVSDVYSPVAGEVVAVNDALPDALETLSADAYGAGWIAKIKISDASGLANLLDFAAYQKQCEEAQ